LTVFGYARISVDIEQDRDNTSIENQKSIIKAYVEDHFKGANLILYSDRDRSGYTFEQREEYMQMRRELLQSESKILVIKDFSRFSRRNSLGLLELETLRDAGVRIISIGDGIDYPTKDDWMLIQFKFLMNEMPVTDTSKKIKAIINNRQRSGKWVCAVPYGYRLINTKEMIYEIDPPAADIVRKIFELYNNGWGYKKIANSLTDKGIPTPRANEIAWRESKGQRTKLSSKSEWSIVSISGILSNDFYIGTLRQKKYTRKGINGKDQKLDDDDQIVLENAHQPIIDTKTFLYTQEQLKIRSKNNYRGNAKYNTDYSGYLFCGNCGSPMFSVSRSDLKPSYVCGTYQKRGLKGCTRHHIRVEMLDNLLKRYIRTVRDSSQDMLSYLENAIKCQPEREEEIGLSIGRLETQLSDAKKQLQSLLKRKVIDTMNKSPEEAEIIGEAYHDLEKELTQRIKGLENQINSGIDSRNQLIKANRAAKTVIDVFNDILSKPNLDKRDIGLIVEHITVYEDPNKELGNRIDIQLKADIHGLLTTGVWEEPENFTQSSKDISTTQLVQSTPKRPDKVFTVNVVSEGDPLEIYTDNDGEVIFKKYSPLGELSNFAGTYAEVLHKTGGFPVVVCDRDHVVAVSGVPKKELLERRVSSALEEMMEERQNFALAADKSRSLQPVEGSDRLALAASPILAAGDVCGAVVFLKEENSAAAADAEIKLIGAAASFLGRQMEE